MLSRIFIYNTPARPPGKRLNNTASPTRYGVDRGAVEGYMRNTPKSVGATGACAAAASAIETTARVWAGSMIPAG